MRAGFSGIRTNRRCTSIWFPRNTTCVIPNLLRTRGSYESLTGPNGELNEVWPIRPTRGVNRGYQYGILRARRHAREIHVGVRADGLSRRSPARRVVRQRVRRRSDGQPRQPSSFWTTAATASPPSKAYRDVRGEFLASTDERFRPVNLSLAPDGTLYVVDMYRGIIQHKGYMTEYLRDYVLTHKLEQPNSFGRIYRIVHETTRRDHDAAADAVPRRPQLVQLLSHPNGWRRDMAQQLLVERGDKSVVPALRKLALERGRRSRAPEGVVGARRVSMRSSRTM